MAKKNRRNLFSKSSGAKTFRWNRLAFFESLVYVGFAIILVRGAVIQLFPPSEKSLSKMALRQYHKPLKLSNYRGKILDRRGEPLAISVKSPSLAVNPRLFRPTSTDIKRLKTILNLSTQSITKISRQTNYFAWLKRKTSHEAAEKVLRLQIPGIYKITEPSRFYPLSNYASHIIGKVDIDNKGVFGLERSLDKSLSGEAGEISAVRDGKGQVIFQNSKKVSPEVSGHHTYLTIDRVIQEITSKHLKNGVEQAGAKGGFAIVGNPHTGEIYALASYPDYNPNSAGAIAMSSTKNKAISDIFEPGSVVKPFVVARAIDMGRTTIDTENNCEKSGVYRFGRNKIRDDHPKETLTSGEVLIHSSNICTFKIAKQIGPSQLHKLYEDIGFSKSMVKFNLPGQTTGRLPDYKNWRDIRFANISFGQGHSVNGMQLLRAYYTLANGGKFIEPYLVSKVTDNLGNTMLSHHTNPQHTVFKSKTTLEIRNALHEVTLHGTARLAQTKDYATAGKTGTSEKFDRVLGAYSKTKRTASFAGFAPYLDPKITVVVIIDEPSKKPYYGGKWAAPVFGEIVQSSLKYLNIPPDKITKESRFSTIQNESKPKEKEKL